MHKQERMHMIILSWHKRLTKSCHKLVLSRRRLKLLKKTRYIIFLNDQASSSKRTIEHISINVVHQLISL